MLHQNFGILQLQHGCRARAAERAGLAADLQELTGLRRPMKRSANELNIIAELFGDGRSPLRRCRTFEPG